MILDDQVVEFLVKTEPLYIHLAVSDANKRPYSLRCFGVRTYEGSDQLSVYILKSQAEKLLSIVNNGKSIVACLFTDGFSNESYQIKGEFLDYRSSDDEKDYEILNNYRKGSLKIFPKLYMKYPLSKAHCDVITYQATDIFVHTPGPYAGKKYQRRNDT
ncbi:hypothetical protein [Bacillus sp. 03113]|uniref:hypothetical protein n=1 Tax=Bacillus sp. 03113 TaxID=2578211 RepID=UPI001142ED16|nr:hypothetical protein [Bacillus sp. 03113]